MTLRDTRVVSGPIQESHERKVPMTRMEVLSSGECRSLCREAAVLVLRRFRLLATQSDPGDRPLTLLFGDLAAEVERSLVEIGPLEIHEPETGRGVAGGFLPSLSKSPGGGELDRESGLYLAECIFQDLAGFYGTLVRQTGDERSKALLQRSKSAAESRLEYLRTVVMKEPL